MFPWSLLLNPRVIGTVVGIAVIIGLFTGTYYKGKSVERAKWELAMVKVEAEAKERVKEVENAKREEIREIEIAHQNDKEVIGVKYNDVVADLGRLRVKRCPDNNMSRPSATSGGVNGGTSVSAIGLGPSRIDPDQVERDIIELGRDLDECNSDKRALQSAVRSYSERGRQK